MDTSNINIRSNQKFSRIPSSILDLNYFKKLYQTLTEISKEGARLENENYTKTQDQTDEEFKKMKEETFDLYKVSILIFGTKGEQILSHNISALEENNLPDVITQISFDNSLIFNSSAKQNPQNRFRVIFDFIKPSISNFTPKPSINTNNSSIEILGQNDNWVNGAYEQIISSLKERKTKRNWLYANNIYEAFLLLIFFPLSFWNLHKISEIFSISSLKLPPAIETGLYIYIFIVLLWLFRIIFNYARWLFPYIEINYGFRKREIAHRFFLFGLITTLIYSFIRDLVVLIISS
jgi:hypothetical protein